MTPDFQNPFKDPLHPCNILKSPLEAICVLFHARSSCSTRQEGTSQTWWQTRGQSTSSSQQDKLPPHPVELLLPKPWSCTQDWHLVANPSALSFSGRAAEPLTQQQRALCVQHLCSEWQLLGLNAWGKKRFIPFFPQLFHPWPYTGAFKGVNLLKTKDKQFPSILFSERNPFL